MCVREMQCAAAAGAVQERQRPARASSLMPCDCCAAKRDRSDTGSSPQRPGDAQRPRTAGGDTIRVHLDVEIQKGGQAVGTLELPALKPHQRCVFGRGDTADVKVEHASISRAHAELSVSSRGVVTLVDLASGAPSVPTAAFDANTRHLGVFSFGDGI